MSTKRYKIKANGAILTVTRVEGNFRRIRLDERPSWGQKDYHVTAYGTPEQIDAWFEKVKKQHKLTLIDNE